MRADSSFLLAAGCLAMLLACGAKSTGELDCGPTGLSLRLHTIQGRPWPDGDYELRVTRDGISDVCAFTLPLGAEGAKCTGTTSDVVAFGDCVRIDAGSDAVGYDCTSTSTTKIVYRAADATSGTYDLRLTAKGAEVGAASGTLPFVPNECGGSGATADVTLSPP
jgi:hypothetical protein